VTPCRVAEALALARALGVERLDAQVLLARRLGRSRAWLLAHDDAALSRDDAEAVVAWLKRRADGEPVAYLVGEREFHGLTLTVTPAVLVPRPDTEALVGWALELLAGPLGNRARPRVLDLGTGSGAIALAVAQACPRAEVHASDASPAALDVARGNAERLRLPTHMHLGSWWQAVRDEPPFDLVLSNPPYVAPNDAHLASLRHEPLSALVPEGDAGAGLADLQRIAAGTAKHLRPGGWLLLEHGAGQAAEVRALLRHHGLPAPITRRDLAGHERVTGGAIEAAEATPDAD
jgi:release factor glutamine methyltransferase